MSDSKRNKPDPFMDDKQWAERAGSIAAQMLMEAARKQRKALEEERDAAVAALRDTRLGACRMDGPNGPECWCGRPSAFQSGECNFHGTQALRAFRCERAEQERDEAVKQHGRLIGEWEGVIIHSEGMAVLLDRFAEEGASSEQLRAEAADQRAYAAYLRARPPRPAEFSGDDELHELRRAEADAAVAAMRFRESHRDDEENWQRLRKLWLDAAARVNGALARRGER